LAGNGPLADAEQDKFPVLAAGAAACWPDPAAGVVLALGAALAGAALWCGWGRGLGAGFRACRARYSARLCDAGRVTNLPHAGAVPGYAAYCASHQA
jgi:hypothetical protein